VFFGNPINENQRGEAIPKRGKIAILTPKNENLHRPNVEKSRFDAQLDADSWATAREYQVQQDPSLRSG
jgi:hypothetical protein